MIPDVSKNHVGSRINPNVYSDCGFIMEGISKSEYIYECYSENVLTPISGTYTEDILASNIIWLYGASSVRVGTIAIIVHGKDGNIYGIHNYIG